MRGAAWMRLLLAVVLGAWLAVLPRPAAAQFHVAQPEVVKGQGEIADHGAMPGRARSRSSTRGTSSNSITGSPTGSPSSPSDCCSGERTGIPRRHGRRRGEDLGRRARRAVRHHGSHLGRCLQVQSVRRVLSEPSGWLRRDSVKFETIYTRRTKPIFRSAWHGCCRRLKRSGQSG